MENSNLYKPNATKSKIELYKEKLAERNKNQAWIFNNYFGKPGAGAPLKDKTGNAITKMKTIANGQIYLLPSSNFSKTIEDSKSQDTPKPFSQTYTKPSSFQKILPSNVINPIQSEEIPSSNLIQSQQLPITNKLNLPNSTEYLQKFKINPLYPFPPPIYLMFPHPNYPSYPYPFPYYYPSPYPLPYSQIKKDTEISSSIQVPKLDNKDNAESLKESDNQTLIPNYKSDDGYCLPSPKDENEIIQDKEKKKLLWQQELLAQIEEKKKREENEKKKFAEIDKLEEIRYQEYLRVKREQAEQQEIKRQNKINQKLKELAINDSTDQNLNQLITNELSEQGDGINPEISQTQIQQAQIGEETQNQNILSPQDINQQNQSEFHLDEFNRQESFKNLIDNEIKNLKDKLYIDLDKEKEKFEKEYENKFSSITRNLLNLSKGMPRSISQTKENSERKLNNLQFMIGQRNLINFIFDKPKIKGLEEFDCIIPETEPKIPSFFGINRDNTKSKYTNLHSTSTFIVDMTKDMPNVNNVLVEKDSNNNNIKEDDRRNWENGNKKLEGQSSFIPIEQDVNSKNEKAGAYVPGELDFVDNEDREFREMNETLDEIGEINKKIDPSAKLKSINGAFNIDLEEMKRKDIEMKQQQELKAISN